MKIKVKVHPNSSKEEIKELKEDKYEIWIHEKAEDNKANLSLIKLLKRHFKSGVFIISGFKSRNKIIKVNS
jgi:uncharacterized protein (TIGR00251 family)